MFSVALIGSDGAGKSTIARMLEQSFPRRVRTLYMGINLGSSDKALPTSRLFEFLRQKRQGGAGDTQTLHQPAGGNKKKHGSLWRCLRLANRLAEECYRQLLSWNYQRKGWIVIYDRHFRFDFPYAPEAKKLDPLADRIHRWWLAKIYPSPDLVIYLDAPPEVLFARKGEATLEWLDARRQELRREAERTHNFVQVDATQPLELVYSQVARHIELFSEARCGSDLSPKPERIAVSAAESSK